MNTSSTAANIDRAFESKNLYAITAMPAPKISTSRSQERSTSMRVMSGTPSEKSPKVSHWRSGSWAVETGGSLSTSSCSRTAAPIGRGRPTTDSERSAPESATPSSPQQSLRREPRGLNYGKREERLEANPSEPPAGHQEGLCGALSRRPLELDELSHEESCQHRHEGLLSGIFPGHW